MASKKASTPAKKGKTNKSIEPRRSKSQKPGPTATAGKSTVKKPNSKAGKQSESRSRTPPAWRQLLNKVLLVAAKLFGFFVMSGVAAGLVNPLLNYSFTDGSSEGSLSWFGMLVGACIVMTFFVPGVVVYRRIRKRQPSQRLLVIGSVVTVVSLTLSAVLIASATPIERNATRNAPPNSKVTNQTRSMPRLKGMKLSDARKTLKSVQLTLQVNEIDLLSSRSVWAPENWTVMQQSPLSGSNLKAGGYVCLGVVKNDETWQTVNPLECWESAGSELASIGGDYQLVQDDLLRLSSLPLSLSGMQLKAELKIEMDRGNTVFLPYCTYAPVQGTFVNLKLDAGNSGDPGLFADGGQSFEAGLFLDWPGKYRYSIESLEKSATSKCGS